MNLIILGKPSQSHGNIEIAFYVLAANCTGVSDKAIFMTPESFLGSLLSYNPWLGWSWSNPIWGRSVKQTRPTQPAPVSLDPSTPVTVTKSSNQEGLTISTRKSKSKVSCLAKMDLTCPHIQGGSAERAGNPNNLCDARQFKDRA